MIPELLSSWEDIITQENGEEYIKGENDTFHLEKQDSRWSANSLLGALPTFGSLQTKEDHAADQVNGSTDDRILDYNKVIKRIIPHETTWPGAKETPYYNHNSFYANLRRYQQERSSEAEEFGKYLMYASSVTLDHKNASRNFE